MNVRSTADDPKAADSPAMPVRLMVAPRRVLITIILVACALGLAHMVVGGILFAVGSPRTTLANLVDLNREATPATWFSAVLLLSVAGLIGMLRAVSTGGDRRRWTVLGLFGVFPISLTPI